jgi:tetratricopeptide (TPR) repeat protein
MNAPAAERVVAVQALLESLGERVESEPDPVLRQLLELISEVKSWPDLSAFAWASYIGAQACRFLDRLDQAVGIAEAALKLAGDKIPQLAAHLRLELGMALTQAGHYTEALPALEAAAEWFAADGDTSGLARALVSLGTAHRVLGQLSSSSDLLGKAVDAAQRAEDDRLRRRALRESAVTWRHRGESVRSLEILEELLPEEPAESHGRANTLAELGHSSVQLHDLEGAQRAYRQAALLYARWNDPLGAANVERAVGNIAAQLSRYSDAMTHLNAAVTGYETAGYRHGLANALWDRSLVRLACKDTKPAMADAFRAWRLFLAARDTVGESGALRAMGQVAYALGRESLCARVLARSLRLSEANGVQLAIANTLLHQTEMTGALPERYAAAIRAASIYEQMDLPVGIAQAASHAARLALDLGDRNQALAWAARCAAEVGAARRRLGDHSHRADFGPTAARATSRAYHVCAALGGPEAVRIASDLVIDEGAIAIGDVLHRGRLPARITRPLAQLTAGGPMPDTVRSGLLNRIGAYLTAVDPKNPPPHTSFAELAAAYHPAAVLAFGTPVDGRNVTVAFSAPGHETTFELRRLSAAAVDIIDAIGLLSGGAPDLDLLWDPDATTWTRDLSGEILPAAMLHWLRTRPGTPLILLAHPSLAHLPFEALLVDGTPLGVLCGIRRQPAPVFRSAMVAGLIARAGFADPDLRHGPERAAFGEDHLMSTPAAFREALGPGTLIWACCHGETGIGLDRYLRTDGGARVLDAGDLLGRDLTHSIVVLESCPLRHGKCEAAHRRASLAHRTMSAVRRTAPRPGTAAGGS